MERQTHFLRGGSPLLDVQLIVGNGPADVFIAVKMWSVWDVNGLLLFVAGVEGLHRAWQP